MGRSLPSLVLAIPRRYSRPKFMKTSETIEFSLDFYTGLTTGCGKLFESRSVRIGGLVFSAEKGSYPCKQGPSNGRRFPEGETIGDY
jgi:hypothetical protein